MPRTLTALPALLLLALAAPALAVSGDVRGAKDYPASGVSAAA